MRIGRQHAGGRGGRTTLEGRAEQVEDHHVVHPLDAVPAHLPAGDGAVIPWAAAGDAARLGCDCARGSDGREGGRPAVAGSAHARARPAFRSSGSRSAVHVWGKRLGTLGAHLRDSCATFEVPDDFGFI